MCGIKLRKLLQNILIITLYMIYSGVLFINAALCFVLFCGMVVKVLFHKVAVKKYWKCDSIWEKVDF